MEALLRALASSGPRSRHGYDLMTDTGLKSGTLYPLLMRMADRGLVEAEWQAAVKPGRPPRHVYRLTPQGAELATAIARQDEAGDRPRIAWA